MTIQSNEVNKKEYGQRSERLNVGRRDDYPVPFILMFSRKVDYHFSNIRGHEGCYKAKIKVGEVIDSGVQWCDECPNGNTYRGYLYRKPRPIKAVILMKEPVSCMVCSFSYCLNFTACSKLILRVRTNNVQGNAN